MNDDRPIFLTDDTRFIGPYLPGDIAINRGVMHLQDGNPAVEVHTIRAADDTAARRAWAAAR